MEVFDIAPAGTRGMLVIGIVLAVVLVPVVGLLGLSMAGARGARFEVSAEGLRLRGDLYGRQIPADRLVVAGARRLDFEREPEMAPRWRTFGTGMPGYQAGWFRLRNGEKALLYLTDRRRTVYVPTTEGYGVMLSPADPERFLAAIGGLGPR